MTPPPMNSLWDNAVAQTFDGPIGDCVYSSRLIGADPSLVLHGGGNSSVKAPFGDITGRDIEAIYVKGSGWDMSSIETPGFAPLRLARLRELLDLEELSDPDMARELAAAKLDPGAPNPSVESLLHAYLPFTSVLHSHADVIITLTNAPGAEARVGEIYGDDVVFVPYVKPGFDLARVVVKLWPRLSHDGTIGMVLSNHGLFTFGEDDRTAYESHIELVDRGQAWLAAHAPQAEDLPGTFAVNAPPRSREFDPVAIATLRRDISEAANRPMVIRRTDTRPVRRFLERSDLADIATSGPLSPDHVIRTKRVPLIGRDVGAYVTEYLAYVEEHRDMADPNFTVLDAAPRVVLDRALGLLTAGETFSDAGISADIYQQTIPVIQRAQDHLGGYRALPARDIFEVEYWNLEQAKLRRRPTPKELSGQIALVTGAASGIGLACAHELAGRGALVVGVDITDTIEQFDVGPGSLGVRADVTDAEAVRLLPALIADHAGGLDMLVLSAGMLGPTMRIVDYDAVSWQQVHDLNSSSAVALMAASHPLLSRSPVGGRVVAIASKNVPAPGPGAGAYSTSKAALMQLVRVAALEWAGDGIRVNAVHPDAVFDTALWSDEVLAARAEHYGMSVQEYKRRNLLGLEITSRDVAATVAALCSASFRATTGAAIPVDGGNERVI